MSNLFCLTEAQIERLRPFFTKSHGKPRVLMPSRERNDLYQPKWVRGGATRQRNTARTFEGDRGPSGAAQAPESLHGRWKRCGEMGVFARIMDRLATEAGERKIIMIDAP